MKAENLKKLYDEQAKILKEKGHTAEEIDEVLFNLKSMYDKALEDEEKELDKEIKKKEEALDADIEGKIKSLWKELKDEEKKENKEAEDKKNKVFGFKNDKNLSELEGDEKTFEWFKNLINATKDKFDIRAMENVKALSEGTDADGGHLVPEEFQMQLIEDLRDATVMRVIGATVWPMASKTLELPKLGSRPQTSWGSENTTISTTTADFGNLVLTAYKLVSRLYTSTELAEDSTPGVVELIRRLFVTAMSEEEDKAFFTGSGTGRPKGITQETLGSVNAGGALTGDHLIELVYEKLKAAYQRNAKWAMNQRTWAAVLKLKDSNNQYLVDRAILRDGADPVLLGKPVSLQNDLPSSEVYLGDWSYYYIGDRSRISVATSTEADDTFKKDQIQIKVRSRVDGRTALTNAFKKITSTGVS